MVYSHERPMQTDLFAMNCRQLTADLVLQAGFVSCDGVGTAKVLHIDSLEEKPQNLFC